MPRSLKACYLGAAFSSQPSGSPMFVLVVTQRVHFCPSFRKYPISHRTTWVLSVGGHHLPLISVSVGTLIRSEGDEIQFLSVEEDTRQKRLYRDLYNKDIFFSETILFYFIYLFIAPVLLAFVVWWFVE